MRIFPGAEPIPRDLGAMGEVAIYVNLFAVRDDPGLASFVGYQGNKNRRKLAETFKRPVNWGQYCDEIAPTNCEEPDPVAQRRPEGQYEKSSYFVEDLYMGK